MSSPRLSLFLKSLIYLAAHRYAFEHLNILHRDISLGNIVINPKEARKPRILDTPDRPKFITETLDKYVTRLYVPRLTQLIGIPCY